MRSQISSKPPITLHNPKNRICPSRICTICRNMRFHCAGERNGSIPSMTSTRANASQKTSPESKPYFFADAGGATVPRKDRKNSVDDGSSTITSPFLLKLIL